MSLLPNQVKKEGNTTEQKKQLNLYSEIFEKVKPTDNQREEAEALIRKYGNDDMLMGVTNNNALVRKDYLGTGYEIPEGGSFVDIENDVYRPFKGKLLKDDKMERRRQFIKYLIDTLAI